MSAKSNLAGRGLELASLLQQQRNGLEPRKLESEELILPVRRIEFPADRPMGRLFIRRWNNLVETKEGEWQELGEACGEFLIPAGMELMLDLAHAASADLSPLSTFSPNDLQRIGAANTQFDDQGLGCIQNLTGLIELWLMGTRISDEGLKFAQNMSGLRTLNLSGTYVTDTGLRYLRGLTNLAWLFLDGTRISDEGLEYLKDLRNLKVLILSQTHVTEAGRARIKNALPGCQVSSLRIEL